jgi:carboxypeptidase T
MRIRSRWPREGLALLVVLAAQDPSAARAADPIPAPGARGAYRDRVYVRARPRDGADVERIWSAAEDVLSPHDPGLVEHELIVTRATLGRLQAAGLPTQVLDLDVQRWIDDSMAGSVRPAPKGGLARASTFGDWFSKVQPLDAITAYLRNLEQASGGRATLKVIGKSIEQRDLLALRISSAPAGAQRPSVLVIGTHHAREWASPMVAMGLADALVRRYDDEPRIRRVVDNLEIVVIPVLNPDGYVATFNGKRLQRKNMDPKCNVDLNRNYDAAFGKGTGGECPSETYPGPSAFSEPETQAVRELVASLARPRLLVDYHSAAAVIMIPFAYTQSPPPQLAENKALCQLYSSAVRSVSGTNYPAVPGYDIARGAGGGAFDWFRTKYGHTIVVELRGGGGPGGFDLPARSVIPFAEENLAGWLAVAEKLVESEPDAGTAEPTDAGLPADAPPPADLASPVTPDLAIDQTTHTARPDAGPSAEPPLDPPGDEPTRTAQPSGGCTYAPGAPAAGHAFLVLALVLSSRRRRQRTTVEM